MFDDLNYFVEYVDLYGNVSSDNWKGSLFLDAWNDKTIRILAYCLLPEKMDDDFSIDANMIYPDYSNSKPWMVIWQGR